MNGKFNPRIAGALFFGAVLMGGSWWWVSHGQSDIAGRIAAIGKKDNETKSVNDIDLSAYINPNWQDYIQNGAASSTYKTPTTLTGRYAISTLEQLMLSNMEEDGGMPPRDIATRALGELEQATADKQYQAEEVTTTKDISPATLKQYGNAVMQITLNYPSPYEVVGDEVEILESAWESEDETDLAKLDTHVEYMESVLSDTEDLTVPIIYLGTHLTLLNAYQAHLNDLKAMRAAFEDPLFTMVRLRKHNANLEAIYNAYNTLYNQMYLNGVRWNESDVAGRFVVVGNTN